MGDGDDGTSGGLNGDASASYGGGGEGALGGSGLGAGLGISSGPDGPGLSDGLSDSDGNDGMSFGSFSLSDTGFSGINSPFGESLASFDTPSLMGMDTSFADSYGGAGVAGMNDGLSGMFGGTDSGSAFGNSGMLGSLASFFSSPFGKTALGLLGLANPALGMAAQVANMGLQASQGKGGATMGGALGGQIGSVLGTGIAGPVGGILGGQFGGMAGANALAGHGGEAAGGQAAVSGMSGQGMTDAMTSLGGLYAAHRARQGARDAQNQLTQMGGQGSLASLYGQDSPYAQQLRQQLERRDAAAGRRSQYGPREVELQSKLAEFASRNMPQMANVELQRQAALNQYRQQADAERNRKISAGLILAKNSGLMDQAGRGLAGLFGG